LQCEIEVSTIATQRKRTMKNLLLVAFLAIGISGFSQSTKPITTSFKVGGTCEMCKKRIERAVDVKGVKYANYNLKTHTLEITFVPSKISEEKIHELINAAGHDTEKSNASDEVYDKIHECCKYRDHKH